MVSLVFVDCLVVPLLITSNWFPMVSEEKNTRGAFSLWKKALKADGFFSTGSLSAKQDETGLEQPGGWFFLLEE